MIVQEMDDGRLFCIRQTSHALMAADFCRHWGNGDFATPAPYAAVMMAIAQHDNGWYEWERSPELRDDGYPMDFMHGPGSATKIALWERGIARVDAQHPYAGLLVRRHATLLYVDSLSQHTDPEAQDAMQRFVDRWPTARTSVQSKLAGQPGLTNAAIDANARLLQFGDSASLQVCVPWSRERRLHHCPIDGGGTYTEITMTHTANEICFDPWPFGVEHFEVSVFGHILAQQHFASTTDYQAALAAAPAHVRSWTVAPS